MLVDRSTKVVAVRKLTNVGVELRSVLQTTKNELLMTTVDQFLLELEMLQNLTNITPEDQFVTFAEYLRIKTGR